MTMELAYMCVCVCVCVCNVYPTCKLTYCARVSISNIQTFHMESTMTHQCLFSLLRLIVIFLNWEVSFVTNIGNDIGIVTIAMKSHEAVWLDMCVL